MPSVSIWTRSWYNRAAIEGSSGNGQQEEYKSARPQRERLKALVGGHSGNREYLVFQLIRLVEQFFTSDKLLIPSLYHQEPLRKRILLALNIDLIVQHLLRFVREQNLEHIEPVFDEERPIGSTREMRTWYTTKRCHPTQKSQISHVVADSTWEQYVANALESSELVSAYAKNDHLGFQVHYLWNGARRRYIPDFLIRLANGKTLVLEVKGEDSEQDRAKRSALDAWVKGVNAKGGFGIWGWDVITEPAQILDRLTAAC
jgi:type III restriction enzyme